MYVSLTCMHLLTIYPCTEEKQEISHLLLKRIRISIYSVLQGLINPITDVILHSEL